MVKISGVIITLNEESDIERALRSISWCDEIIVVDSGSTDRTVQICQAYGCKVIRREFDGYGEQKRFAVNQATHDWIICIDADEVIPAELKEEILSHLSVKDLKCPGFYLPISLVLWDGVIRNAGRFARPKLRLFDRRFGTFNSAKVHESVQVKGQCGHLRHRMYNYSYSSISDYLTKFNAYTSAAALERFDKGKSASVFQTVARFPFEFLKLYLVQSLIWDGWHGFVWSLFSAFYPVVKNIKLFELHQQTQAAGLRVLGQDGNEQPRVKDKLATAPTGVAEIALQTRTI